MADFEGYEIVVKPKKDYKNKLLRTGLKIMYVLFVLLFSAAFLGIYFLFAFYMPFDKKSIDYLMYCFVLAGLGVRFDWFMLPVGVSIGAAVVFFVAYLLYAEVMRENAYLSRTVKVEEGQRVVDTGLYGIVRHPMYAVTLLLFLAIPLVLGSFFALPVFLIYPFLIAIRIKHEEELLEKELEGYSEYKTRVKYRLIPFIW